MMGMHVSTVIVTGAGDLLCFVSSEEIELLIDNAIIYT
jgi:hypothetical protein